MELYLIRHGQSTNNILNQANHPDRWRLRKDDPPLSPLGVAQAEAAARVIREVGLDRLYCAPQIRGLHTASIIAERSGMRAEARPDHREDDADRGDTTYPGLPAAEIRARFPLIDLGPGITDRGWWFFGPETEEEIRQRARDVVRWLRKSFGDTKLRVGLVTHQGVGSVIMRELLDIPPTTSAKLKQANCAISRFTVSADHVDLDFLNDRYHLPDAADPGLQQLAL